jgi:hypothetical protein
MKRAIDYDAGSTRFVIMIKTREWDFKVRYPPYKAFAADSPDSLVFGVEFGCAGYLVICPDLRCKLSKNMTDEQVASIGIQIARFYLDRSRRYIF